MIDPTVPPREQLSLIANEVVEPGDHRWVRIREEHEQRRDAGVERLARLAQAREEHLYELGRDERARRRDEEPKLRPVSTGGGPRRLERGNSLAPAQADNAQRLSAMRSRLAGRKHVLRGAAVIPQLDAVRVCLGQQGLVDQEQGDHRKLKPHHALTVEPGTA